MLDHNADLLKRIYPITFIVLGFFSLTAQVMLLRELTVSFFGNEFFLALALAGWLFWVGLGALFAGRTSANGWVLLTLSFLVTPLLLLAEIGLIRAQGLFLTRTPGAVPNALLALSYGLIALAPLSLGLGGQFVALLRLRLRLTPPAPAPGSEPGKAYLYETVGFIIAGLLYNSWLIYLNEFSVVCLLAVLNLTLAFLLHRLGPPAALTAFPKPRSAPFVQVAVVAASLYLGLFFLGPSLQKTTQSWRFPHQQLLQTQNSPYGQLAVTQTQDQVNFYENGLPLATSAPEMASESFVHLPLLYHPAPRRILLIGNGLGGALTEIAKHHPETVDYLETDPLLITLARRYLTTGNRLSPNQKNLQILPLDGLSFLRTSRETFDVILINLPLPTTILLNRFYTQDFFQLIKAHLSPGGLFATQLPGTEDYLNAPLKIVNASLYKTLKEVFPHLILFPGDTNYFLASDADILNYDPRPLIQRLEDRQIKGGLVSAGYLRERLTNPRIKNTLGLLSGNREALNNRDDRPTGYYYSLVYWLSLYQPILAGSFGRLATIEWSKILIIVSAIAGVVILGKRRAISQGRLIYTMMATGGLSLMAGEILIIFVYQTFYGYLYHRLALILAFLMLGMALGSWLANHLSRPAKLSLVVRTQALMTVLYLLLISFFWGLKQLPLNYLAGAEPLIFLLAMPLGGTVGWEFSYLSALPNMEKKSGFLYAADLLGSSLGALLVSLFTLPLGGVYPTLLMLVLLNGSLTLLLVRRRDP